MIRVGDTILNEDFIAAIRPANDDGIIVPADIATLTIVSLSSGEQVIIRAPMMDASRALERAGFLEPVGGNPIRAFTIGELDELKARYEQGYLFAAKDEDGKAFVYTARPTKGKVSWINDDDTSIVRRLHCCFDALSFDDDNPLEIASLLDRLGVEA